MTLNLTTPRGIIFDWDNTIIDAWDPMHKAMNDTLYSMGHTEWTLDEAKERIAHSMKDSFPEMFGDRWEEAGELYRRQYYKHRSGLTLMPGAGTLIDWLHEKTTLDLFVVSNKLGPTLREEVDALGWKSYFFSVIGSQDAEADKPSPAPVHLALEGSDLKPGADIWFIGDSVADIECACRSGCTPIYFGDRDCEDRVFGRFQPAIATSSLEQFLDILKRIC